MFDNIFVMELPYKSTNVLLKYGFGWFVQKFIFRGQKCKTKIILNNYQLFSRYMYEGSKKVKCGSFSPKLLDNYFCMQFLGDDILGQNGQVWHIFTEFSKSLP